MSTRRYVVAIDGRDEPLSVEIVSDDGDMAVVRVFGPDEDAEPTELRLSLADLGDARHLLRSGDAVETVDVVESRNGAIVLAGADAATLTVTDERDTWLGAGGAAAGDGLVTVAMPGKVVAIDVAPGDEVTRGQRLLIIEAMKMENDVKSPKDGVVKAIRVAAGDAVEAGQALVELD